MNYSELIYEGTAALEHAGITEAALDARLLLEYLCDTDRNTLYAHPDLEVSQVNEERYRALIDRRAKHVPLQHLTGEQEFMGLKFKVTRDVLVPRQDTEFLVEEVLRYAQDGMNILDICTGSGCILLSIMNYKNNINGVGTDISQEALEIAKINSRELGHDAIFLQGNLFEALNQCNDVSIPDKFDIIVSNPPYIRRDVIPTLSPEVRDYDPRLALDGGVDGLDFYRQIIEEAKAHLTNYGRVFFEIGYDQAEDVSELLIQAGYREVQALTDYAGNPRVVSAEYVFR